MHADQSFRHQSVVQDRAVGHALHLLLRHLQNRDHTSLNGPLVVNRAFCTRDTRSWSARRECRARTASRTCALKHGRMALVIRGEIALHCSLYEPARTFMPKTHQEHWEHSPSEIDPYFVHDDCVDDNRSGDHVALISVRADQSTLGPPEIEGVTDQGLELTAGCDPVQGRIRDDRGGEPQWPRDPTFGPKIEPSVLFELRTPGSRLGSSSWSVRRAMQPI